MIYQVRRAGVMCVGSCARRDTQSYFTLLICWLLRLCDLAGKATFLEKAKDLGNRLLPAFNTASGLPRASIVVRQSAAARPHARTHALHARSMLS